jgi:hypothetical protein
MATTYTLISKVDVGVLGATTVSFTSIPSTFTDLCFVTSIRTSWATDNNDQFQLQFNGDTSASYPHKIAVGTGSGLDWDGGTGTAINPQGQTSSSTSNTFGSFQFYVPNYAGSNKKSVSVDGVTENNGTAVYTQLGAYLWDNTSAITSALFKTGRGVGFAQYSSFYLYGIKNS